MFACQFHRFVRRLGPASPSFLRRQAARHHGACPDCQARAAAEDTLARQLRRQAPADRRPTPPHLATRIRLALQDPAPRPTPRFTRFRWPQIALAGVAVTAAILAFHLWPRPPAPSIDLVEFARHQRQLLTQKLEAVPTDRLRALAEADALLQAELDALIADSRAAARFLAQAALPDTFLPPPR